MKKHLKVEFLGSWILKHRDDDILPVKLIEKDLKNLSNVSVSEATLASFVICFDDSAINEAELEKNITEVFNNYYPDDDADKILEFSIGLISDEVEEKTTASEGSNERTHISFSGILHEDHRLRRRDKFESASSEEKEDFNVAEAKDKITQVKNKIDRLVGAAEFKLLADEVLEIAPALSGKKIQDVFTYRSYLFSIGDGCGLSTYLNLFAELINATGLLNIKGYNAIREVKLGPVKESMDPFEEAINALDSGSNGVKLLSIDISEWINATDSRFFKRFLKCVEKESDSFIMVFRLPFVEKDILEKIRRSLNDLLFIRTVTIPPLTNDEIKRSAETELDSYGFKVSKSAWKHFMSRISEEKSDGKFYGLNTVKKVVKELLYKKQLSDVRNGKSDNTISEKNMKSLCEGIADSQLTGMEQLNRLVGCENIRKSIEQIISQIELSVKSGISDRPCIHMRFTGNPGTGKTTVARIIGKILKEKGILRSGNFYEYSGRDFCGRYVGETAPKTSSMCRDAYGSVLFIDEAYSLYRGDGNDRDFGKEALDTLIAEMENHRNDFVVIMAGYPDDIKKLMAGNAGLASRMPYNIEFPNFTRDQLYEIFMNMTKSKFKYDKNLLPAVKEYFASMPEESFKSKDFSNARFVRNLFERTWAKASMRCQLENKSTVILTKDDFERASADKEFVQIIPKKTVIGF